MVGIPCSIDSAAIDVQRVNGLTTHPAKTMVDAVRYRPACVDIEHTPNRTDSRAAGIAQL